MQNTSTASVGPMYPRYPKRRFLVWGLAIVITGGVGIGVKFGLSHSKPAIVSNSSHQTVVPAKPSVSLSQLTGNSASLPLTDGTTVSGTAVTLTAAVSNDSG